MAERIYTRAERGRLEPLEEKPFSTEDELQALIAEHPELLDGEQIRPGDPRRWILISREKGIAETSDAAARWAIDHLIIDQDAVPTLAEVKRGSNPEIRRTIVGQMLEYAAHDAQTWTADELRRTFEKSTNERGLDPSHELATLLQADGEADADRFWRDVSTNLAARRLGTYLDLLKDKKVRSDKIAALAVDEPDLGLAIPDLAKKAWDALKNDSKLPTSRAAIPFSPRMAGCNRPVPNTVLKVPTGGGKTWLAISAVSRIMGRYLDRNTGFILWIVPNEVIYTQTLKHMKDRQHPYRQALDRAAAGRVRIMEKADRLDAHDVETHLCVMLLMLQSANRETQESLKMFRDRADVHGFFPPEGEQQAHKVALDRTPNLSVYSDMFPMVKDSLGNDLRIIRPVVVLDEGHRAIRPIMLIQVERTGANSLWQKYNSWDNCFMAMGRRSGRQHQQQFWIAAADVPRTAAHPFYQRLHALLDEHGFDAFVESRCEQFYAPKMGRPSLPPGLYFRSLLIGYFEGIDSERGIGWRLADSLSLRRFLRIELDETTPDHSTISRTRRLIDVETHREVFTWVLQLLAKEGLLKGGTIGVDATTLEANAALRSIVRRTTGESYEEFLKGLATESGIATATREQLARLDKKRKKKGSNQEWQHPHDPDAKITKMKDGRTHLAHKAEHAVDLETGAVVAVTLAGADQGDTTTLAATVTEAAAQVAAVAADEEANEKLAGGGLEEVVADKGYHSNEVLTDLAALDLRSYISEPDRGRRRWRGKAEARQAVYGNRRRMQGARGQRLLRWRAERVERAFAHVCETGGMRRTHLRGQNNVLKRLLIHVGGFNLSLVLRQQLGAGTPAGPGGGEQGLRTARKVPWGAADAVRTELGSLPRRLGPGGPASRTVALLRSRELTPLKKDTFATGC